MMRGDWSGGENIFQGFVSVLACGNGGGDEGERKEVEEVESTMSPCDMSTHDHFKVHTLEI